MAKKKIMIIFLGCYSLFFFLHPNLQAQATDFQERLNQEVNGLFHPVHQEMSRFVISTPPALKKCAAPLLKQARKYQELLDPENRFILYRPTDEGNPLDDDYYGDVTVKFYDSPGGHFRLYYTLDPTYIDNVRDLGYVKQFAGYFDEAWVHLIDILGYKPPVGDNERVEVFIMNIGYYGMTSADDRGLYIIVNNDYSWARNNRDILDGKEAGAMKVTAVHEFFHVVQAEYYFWPDHFYDDNMWWEENTAVWSEDELYDYVDDYLGYLGWPYRDADEDGRWDSGEIYYDTLGEHYYWRDEGWFDYPHFPLDITSWDVNYLFPYQYFEYGGVIWAKFLAERFGKAMIRTIFQQFPSPDISYTALEAIEGAIEEIGQPINSFPEAFIRFKLANLRRDYEEGHKYPLPFHEGSISSYPSPQGSLSEQLSYLSAHYFAFREPASGSKTIRICCDAGDPTSMAVLAVPAATYNGDVYDPDFPLFGTVQRISLYHEYLDDEQNGVYEFSFFENPSFSKLIIIPVNYSQTDTFYNLSFQQIDESSLPPVPQVVDPNSFIREEHPVVHLGWQPVQNVDRYQIWRGLKGDYQSLVFQSLYGDANAYEDSDPDLLYPGQTYLYQIKFINAAGSSSSQVMEVQTAEISPYLCNLRAISRPVSEIEVSFKIIRDGEMEDVLEYWIERQVMGDSNAPVEIKSETPVESSDEEIIYIVYHDHDVLPYTEYTYIITVSNVTTGLQTTKEVTVSLPDNELAPEDTSPKKFSGKTSWCFIAGITPGAHCCK